MISDNRYKYQSLIDFAGRYIYSDNQENVEYNEICSKQIDKTIRRFFIKMGIMGISASFSVIGPIHAYLAHGIKTSTTDLRIPFTEDGSNAEFFVSDDTFTIIEYF